MAGKSPTGQVPFRRFLPSPAPTASLVQIWLLQQSRRRFYAIPGRMI